MKSAAPIDPIHSLENAKSMGSRVGDNYPDCMYYDKTPKQIVVFKHEGRFGPNDQPIWHGHITTWEYLNPHSAPPASKLVLSKVSKIWPIP